MSYFKRARNHKKSYSKTLDEKIAKAYKEFEKTGVCDVILESPSNSTAGVYYAGKEIPEVPAVFTDVPDPNGVKSAGWTQPTNGFDQNDPSTWANAYTDTSWLYNSNEVFGQTGRPVVDSVPTTWLNATQGAGIMTAHVGWGQSLGYLDNNGIYRPLVTAGMMGSTMIPPIARGSHFDGAHYTYAIPDDRWAAMQSIYAKYQEMAASGNVVAQQIKVWYGTSYFFDGPWENIGGVKRETDYHRLINATIFKGAGKYESEPVIPAYTQVIFKDEIGRAQNLNMSGFQKALNSLFGLGNNALQSLTNRIIYGKGGPTGGFAADPKYTKEKIQQIANNISDPEKKADFEKKMADLTSTIEKTAQVQKEAETEAKNIAAKFGLDVALTIFGGAILKGAGAAASKIPGASSIVSKATATGGAVVDKVANLLKLTGKVDDAAALATATKAVNTATKAEQAAKAANALEAIGGTLDDVDDIVAVVGSAKYQAAMTQAKLAGTTTSSSVSNAAFNTLETAIQSGSDDAMRAAVKDVNSKVFGAASGASTKFSNVVSTSNNLNRISKSINTADDLAANADDIGINVGKVYKQLKGVDKKLAQEYASLGKELKTLMSWSTTSGTISNVKSLLKAMDKVAKKVNLVQSYESQGQVLTEKNHLRARREEKRELVEKKFSGKVAKVNIPGPKDHLTVKAIDMLRQYKVGEKEMQEYAEIIGDINQWIRENPKEYEIWKVRYPANDPRLAELNWRTDQQLRASEEYIETRFPQNQKLYKKLKKKIEININATDPTRFKNERAEIVYKKLLSVSRAIKLDTLAPVKKLKEHKIKYKLAEANKSDWKEDFYIWPSYLCEGMTTGSLFNMALNPTGSEPVTVNDLSTGYHNWGGAEEGQEPTPKDPSELGANYEYQIDGTGTDLDGFDGKYLVMSGGSRQNSPGWISTSYFMVLDSFDASKSDSISFTIKAGNNTNGGMKPAGPLYASIINPHPSLANEENGYGILGLPNPDCHVYDPSLPDFKPLFDGTDTIYNYASSGLPYAGHGIPAHQTGEDVTITIPIPENFRLPGCQIFFASEHGHYDSNIQGNYVHHQHLSKQTLPVPGLDGRTIDDLWGFDFTWNLSNYLSNRLYPSDEWQDLDSNGHTNLRSMGWFFWHNIQSAKHPNWPIGEDATAYGQYGGYQVGQYYYGNGDPLPISGATQTDHSNNSNPPTDADYEAVAQMILDKFRRAPVYGIKNVQSSRRLPMNVMVGLDDPAASAFIRIGSGPQEGRTSPKKRKKRVETILRSGKEYTDKYIAPDLPGSNATFGDVQASPTGYGEVQGKFADVKDSDIPGKLNTGATPDAVSSGFVDTPKPDSDSWSSAADKAHSQWESQKRAVDSHNEKINKEKDKLFQRADDIWDDIRKQNYEGEDSSGSPYYAKTDKEMTADYMKAGGEDIDAQMAALDKQYKDEPAYPSSDAFDAGGEFASVDSQDPVNTDPNSSDFDFDKYIESLPPEVRKDMESGNPEDDSIFWTLMSLTGGVVGKVGSGIEKLMNMFGRWFNKGKTADETSMPWGDFRQAIGRKDADPSTLWGKTWQVRQTTGKAAGEGAWNPFRWVYTWATDKGGLMSGPDAATREFIRRFPTQMKSIMEQVSKLSFVKNVEYPTQQLSVEEAEKQAMAIFEDENTDQDKAFEVFDKAYKENEGFTRARTETEAIRDSVKTAQDEYNEAASAWSNAFADNKYTGTKGWLNLPDEQRFEKADMSGDYQTYAADKAFVEKWKADAKKGANVYEIGYNYAEKQPAFKQSRKAYDDHEKVLDKLSSDRAAAYEAVTSFLGGLGPHPSPELARKGYLDCDIECMQKKIKLENAAKAASAKEDKGQKKRESLWNSHISTRNNLRDEYVNRNMNQMNLSIKASDTIRTKIKDMKKVYEEKKKIADELRKTEKERIKAVYDSDWFKKANEELSKSFIIEMERERLNNAWNIDDIANESPSEQDYDNAQGGFDDYLQNYEGLGDMAAIPGYVLDSIKRQYKGGKDYTIEDKKNILNWQQKIKAGLDTGTAIAASPDPGPTPVKPGEVPTTPSSPYLPGKSPYNVAGSWTGGPRTSPLSGAGKGPHPGPGWKWYPDAKGGQGDYLPVPRASAGGDDTQIAKRKKELGSTIADVSQGLSATDAASIAGSQTTSKGTKKKKKYNTKTMAASFKPQGGTLKETTFEKIRKLRKSWDYEGKPTPTETGFPEKEPPERVNGWHPEYGKGHEKRYKKLDPHSAKTMARVKTGDPKVDNIVKKQAKG